VSPDGDWLRLAPGEPGDLLVGSPQPLAGIQLRKPDGTTLRLQPGVRARHRMWWTDDYYLYELKLESRPEGAVFQLFPEWNG
ncbi:MAG TPA: hypothetical protein VF414_10985, partial [Thermoanaerobaculia bacterium]